MTERTGITRYCDRRKSIQHLVAVESKLEEENKMNQEMFTLTNEVPVGSYCVDIAGAVFEVVAYTGENGSPKNATVKLNPGVGLSGGNQKSWSIADFATLHKVIDYETVHNILARGIDGKEAYRRGKAIPVEITGHTVRVIDNHTAWGYEAQLKSKDYEIEKLKQKLSDADAAVGEWMQKCGELEEELEKAEQSTRNLYDDLVDTDARLNNANKTIEELTNKTIEELTNKTIEKLENTVESQKLALDILIEANGKLKADRAVRTENDNPNMVRGLDAILGGALPPPWHQAEYLKEEIRALDKYNKHLFEENNRLRSGKLALGILKSTDTLEDIGETHKWIYDLDYDDVLIPKNEGNSSVVFKGFDFKNGWITGVKLRGGDGVLMYHSLNYVDEFFMPPPTSNEEFKLGMPEDGEYDPEEGDQYEEINHPKHYTSDPSGVECNTIRENWCSNLADSLKYMWRHGQKPGQDAVKDLRKSIWYINAEIDRIQRNRDK